ncbi:MAG TPA: Hsp20/alpha crystallin family protein [Burkholderiaceae bacterium]|nr:Hsp20/alpha crystallin family protein [Burkholderiaceae bacterium]
MTKVSIYDPFADVFPTLFRSLFAEGGEPSQRAVQNGGNTQAVPMRVDVVEAEGAYTVKADLPGVPKDAIHVDIDGNRVTIRAEIKRESEQKDGERVLRSERYYGAFARSFALTDEIDDEKAGAKFENGVLELTLPKKAVAGAKRLSIQ